MKRMVALLLMMCVLGAGMVTAWAEEFEGNVAPRVAVCINLDGASNDVRNTLVQKWQVVQMGLEPKREFVTGAEALALLRQSNLAVDATDVSKWYEFSKSNQFTDVVVISYHAADQTATLRAYNVAINGWLWGKMIVAADVQSLSLDDLARTLNMSCSADGCAVN